MLKARIPNLEMHIYGNGVHGNGLKDRDGTPFGTWQDAVHRLVPRPGVPRQARRRDEGRSRRRGARHAGGEVSNSFTLALE